MIGPCACRAVVLLLAGWVSPSQACEAVEFPSRARYTFDTPGELSWKPVAGATAYNVELLARVPEGRVIEKRSTRVDSNRVDPPRLDRSRPTKISLVVTAVCGTQRGKPAEETILVLPAPGCPAIDGLRASARTISWAGDAGAEFEARVFDAISGALIERWDSRPAGIVVPGTAPAVVAVRRVCGNALGAGAYLFVE